MPTKVIAPPMAGDPRDAQLTWDHPLAVVAARNCQKHPTVLENLIGGVACEGCWDDTLLADYLFAAEHDLPIEITVDPFYIDEIAVELAVKGHEVELTELERTEVKRRLAAIANRRNLLAQTRFAFAAVPETR